METKPVDVTFGKFVAWDGSDPESAPRIVQVNDFGSYVEYKELGRPTDILRESDVRCMFVHDETGSMARGKQIWVVFIPTPGAAGMIGLAGLAAMRRRR